MEEEDGDASTPYWLQSRRNSNTYFRRTASLGGRATTVATQIFFAGAAAILIVFFIIPPFFSSVSQIFRPHLVRRSWDYLNFVLVLFAVLCGFLSRNSNNDETNHNKEEDVSNEFSNSPSIIDRGGVTPRYWLDDRGGDQTVYKRFSRLRSVSSYPDLRLREYEDDERWRFYDDTRVSKCRYEDTDPIYPNQSYRNWQEEAKPPPEDVVQPDREGSNGEGRKVQSNGSEAEKVEVVATAEAEVVEEELTVPSAPPYIPSPPPSPPRAPPQPKQSKRKTKRVYQDVPPKEDKKERDEFVAVATPPTTPIPPPTTVYQRSNKQEKKKGGATKEFLIALRRKKKKQRQQSIDGLDLLFGSDPPLVYTMPQPPPPPPPPPPFLQGLFSSKKGKSKRTNNSNPPPPPPPPPERRYESRASITKLRKAPVESRTSKPNPPARVTQFIGTGSESPLLPIPPPPPPPPFKMPAWKFVKRGDYVRMASDISISSDEPDESDVAQSAGGSMFCLSPDVDTKADDFIARFRAGLKLEKMNSAKRGRSNLGPEPGLDESGS
ncbi:PREDICTED: wiskott-Aldrich syndrome protein family member 2-like [Camelina sativa]|uniref:Wiskott-Aldrich syndrome protein family member 2-like n=1 Tax=Camelina sativa TaxID=90675 RepID=A0ABM0STV1_CAMSA|nr:PREDICTED: wiskott-Aldrich syndrome protein family member 2-like [Camelina sativa]